VLACCSAGWAETVASPLDIKRDGPCKFAAAPAVRAADGKFTITFTLSVATDVEVAILNEKSEVVRHLAAGLLGPNAPAPFAKDSLEQKIVWDGNDDVGKAVAGSCSARVSAGLTSKLEKFVGYEANNVPAVVSVTVGKSGELFVMGSFSYRGETEMRVFDRDGKYLRTIIPYPANTPVERLASVGQIQLDGERLPVLLNGVVRSTYPLINGMRRQNAVLTAKNQLIMVSAIGTLAEQGTPRHLLAFHPEGGAPEGVEFVGPQLRKGTTGMLGGCGEAAVPTFNHLAASPDGETLYLTDSPYAHIHGKGRHGVLRLKWADKESGALFAGNDEAGSDDGHFNTPAGLACDKDGNLYVCDWGNNRVMIFSSNGKLAGKFAVTQPVQMAVHPQSGEIYILSCAPDKNPNHGWGTDVVISKFSAFGKGEPKELGHTAMKGVELMALDATASPPRLWIYGKDGLCPLTDKNGQFESGVSILKNQGVVAPWYVAADAARNKIYYYERMTHASRPEIYVCDTETGARKVLTNGVDVGVDRDGNVYIYNGSDTIERMDPSGKPLSFSAVGSNKLKTKGSRDYGPNLGMPGFAVAPNGNIYVLRASNYGNGEAYGSRMDVYDADGKLLTENVIDGLGYGDCGVGVDAAGNIYIGANLKSADDPYLKPFKDKVPVKPWAFWSGPPRDVPWRYPHVNSYLFYWGSILKFGPKGGIVYGEHPWNLKNPSYKAKPADSLANAPADAVSYRSPSLSYEIKVSGAQWRQFGFGMVPSSGDNLLPDPGCVCHNSHFAVDAYGRVYFPDPFIFSVEALDTNGNRIARIGRYGNADSGGPGSKQPEPAIPFGCPTSVAYSNGKLFVSDSVNRRFVVVALEHEVEASCKVR
jgi:hypothetical protein